MLSTGIKVPLLLSIATSLAAATPIQSLAIRQDVLPAPDCDQPGAVYRDVCWSIKEVDFYLANPVTGWLVTTPKCTGPPGYQDGVGCCRTGEPGVSQDESWSTCFIRLATGISDHDCTTVNPQRCTWDGEVDPTLPQDKVTQIRYVLKAIFSVNNFFTTYNTALNYAFADTLAMVPGLTVTVNAVTPSVSIINILTALTVGLAFLGAPELAATILTMEAVVRYAAQTITLGLMQAPGVAKVLWPQGDEASQIYQISALDQQLSAIKQQMSDLLDRALFLIMDDLPTFVNFTAHGAFADSDKVLTLPNATNSLDLALKTYMTSESLRQNGFAASISRHSTPESMAKSLDSPTCSNIIGGILCGMTTDIRMRDQTNAIFWSESTHLEYVIYHHGSKWSYNIMSAINANGWADMLALFDGAYNCTMQGKAQSDPSKNIAILNPDDTFDTTCMSQLPIHYLGIQCPAYAADGTCLFGAYQS